MRPFLQVSSVILAASVLQTPAQAQTSGVNELEEIIVTAQRRSEALQDVPIAITVATKEQIERDQIYSITDLQRVTPALEVSQTFGGESTGGGRLRGIGTNVFNQTATGSVAIVMDQMPQGNASYPQFYDLAQVEVLRGPQGTLFGQSASAGVINVTTAAPDPIEFAAKFGLDFGNKGTLGSRFGQRVVRGMVNIPLGDTSALRFATLYKNEIGVQRNIFLNRDHDIADIGFRARYRLEASDALTIDLIGETNKTDRDGVNFFAIAKAPTGFANSAASLANFTNCGLTNIDESAQEYCSEWQPEEEVRNWGVTAIIDWQGDSIALTSVTGYRDKNRRQIALNYGRQFGINQANDQRIDNFADQISQELRLSSTGTGPLNYTTGVYYSLFNYKTAPIGNFPFANPATPVGFSVCRLSPPFTCGGPPTAPLVPEFRRADVSVEAQAVFADLTYDLSDAWSIFGGARYTRQNMDFVYSRNDVPLYAPSQDKDTNVSGRLGFRWRGSEAVMVYGSVARGFKGSLLDVTVPGRGVILLEPEVPTAYELGTKLSLLDNQLAVDANVFYSNTKNFQTQSNEFNAAGALITVPGSIPELKSKGFELDVIGNIGGNFTLNAGYMFNDIKFPANYIGDDGSNMGGKQFLSAPEHKLALSGEVTYGIGSDAEGFVNLNAVYKSDLLLSTRSAPTYTYPSHVTVGGSIGVRSADERWTASLFARNLTNENEPIAYLASTFAGSVDGGVRAWPEGGVTLRQVGVSIDFNF